MDAQRPENKKTELVIVLQRLCERTLTKQDVVYETLPVDTGFQSTVKLICLQGEEYVGEACETEKAAEHAAAHQALLVNADTVAAMPAPTKPNRRAKAKKSGQEVVAVQPSAPAGGAQGNNPKTDLVVQLQVHCKRTLTKADVVYETLDLSGTFQSTVRLACLTTKPEFSGQPAETEKAAEHSAAEQALFEQATWSPVAYSPPVATTHAAAQQGSDHKTELTKVLQKIAQRALTKGDVVYDVKEHNGQQIATVRLVCLNNRSFTGQPRETGKAAEHSAAERAVAALSGQAALAPPSKRSRAPSQPQSQAAQAAQGMIVARPAKGPRTVQPLGFLPGGRPFGVETLRAS